ncbi:Arabinogalactan peptide 16 [Nymphaea thermarum]|nr:Arabinogalactan peptide 16 [Nymphaea thermarum]
MEMLLQRLHFIAVLGVFLIGLAFPVMGQQPSAAPSMAPSSDGTSIDQGIAYVLMIAALVLTYLIHPLDASSFYSNFFS